MELWLDTSDLDRIALAADMGVLHGVTTNPSIIAKSGKAMEDVLAAILEAQKGPVTAQVVADDADGMVRQGKALRKFSKRVIVKVPVSQEGIKATHALSKAGIPVMATVVFHPNQVWLSARAGASYIAPYLGRIERSGEDAFGFLGEMVRMVERYTLPAKVLAASVKTQDHLRNTLAAGAHAVTIPDDVFDGLFANELTKDGVQEFKENWKNAAPTRLLS